MEAWQVDHFEAAAFTRLRITLPADTLAARQTRLSRFGVKCCFPRFSMTSITIALSKGRIFEDTAPLLKAAGIVALDDPETSRKLILATNCDNVRLIIVRASDVPTYVQYGAADMGVAGKDVLLEHGGAGLYQPLDLDIARCRMMVAVRDDFDYESAVRRGARLRVATKYLQKIGRASCRG